MAWRASGDDDGDIDFKAWREEVKAVDFLVYDPPQLKPSFFKCLAGLNWMTPRSPFCAAFPCCWAQALQKLVLHPCLGAQTHKISEPDEWLLKMLRNNPSPRCPDFLKGVWWMKDNVANEVLVTFQSMDWENEYKGVKHAHYNWTTELNCYGSLLALKDHTHTFTVSPDRKWINIGPTSWIYVLGRWDKLVRPDGTAVPFTPGEDLMRITFNDAAAGSGIAYQYIVRRVAYETSRGDLVRTVGYKELLKRVNLPTVPGVCCQLGYCNLSEDEFRTAFEPLGDEQIVVYQPEREPEAAPESSGSCCWSSKPVRSRGLSQQGSPSRAGLEAASPRASSPKAAALACCV